MAGWGSMEAMHPIKRERGREGKDDFLIERCGENERGVGNTAATSHPPSTLFQDKPLRTRSVSREKAIFL